MKKNLFLKALALTLSLMLVICSAGLAFAEDVVVEDETKTISGDVNGHVTVTANEDETTKLTVTGSITEHSKDASGGEALLVSVKVDGTATVETGNINHTGEGYWDRGVQVITYGPESQATVAVGDISSDNIGIYVNNYGGTADVTSGDISAEATGVYVNVTDRSTDYKEMTAAEFQALNLGEPDLVEENAPGNTYVEKFIVDKNEEKAIYSHAIYSDGRESYGKYDYGYGFGGKTTVQVNGDITVKNSSQETGYGNASGVQISASSLKGETEINVDGNITVDADYAWGVNMSSYNGNNEAVNVDGNISATGEIAYGVTVGIHNESTGTADVTGNITATGERLADGVELYSVGSDATAEATITGDITAAAKGEEGKATGLIAYAYTDNEVTATVTGDINATGTGEAIGIDVYANEGSEVTVTQKGDITVKGTEEATAIQATNDGGTIDIDITGDVASNHIGLSLVDAHHYKSTGKYEGEITVDPDEYDKETGYYYHYDGEKRIAYLVNSEGKAYYAQVEEDKDHDPGTTAVTITGDVTATETGAVIDLTNDKSKIDLIVDGTLSGETQSVLVSENTIDENLTLTVWEIKANDDGNLVERETADGTTEADREIEKNIQYIIKIEPTQKDIIKTQGTTEYEGYNVANEGDTVTLKVEVPEGYQIKNAFSDSDQTIEMAQDDDGNYYLIVPKGGAVMISVEFEKIPEPEPAPQPAAETEGETKATTTFVQTTSTKVAIMKPADETNDTQAFKDEIQNVDILSILPDDIKELLPEGVSKVAEAITMTLENYDPEMGTVTLKIASKKTYTKGEKATVVIALPDGNGGYTFFYIEGEGQDDGTLNLNIPADTAKALTGKTFVTMILE